MNLNINEEVGATNVRALQARVLAEKADLGIALDGDGDRVIMVDHEEGNKVDGDQILYIIAREGLRQETVARGTGGYADEQYGPGTGVETAGHPVCSCESG